MKKRSAAIGIATLACLVGGQAVATTSSSSASWQRPLQGNWAEKFGVPEDLAKAAAQFTHLVEPESAPSVPGQPGRGTIGPDVIVSQVGPTLSKYGTLNDISAYAMTTVSCNIGDEWAIWVAGNNQHPLIGQNMYRYKVVDGAGRFEMIGMAWLKHGWCAADAPGSGCGSCNQPGSGCNWLGLNCSDTYGASLNADQFDLGPRSEVNATTGVYPYPYQLNWNQTGNAIFKRLQIHNDDINPALNAGAQYFAEVQYMCTDEQDMGNQYNNSSTRRVIVGAASGGGWILSFTTEQTKQQQQALQCWKDVDPDVTLVHADDGSGGRFTLAYKVTDLGDGRWDYEYALQNYNSDRSGGSFSVPVASGVNISSTGFHDVFYHSGEPYSGEDWTATRGSDSLTWATQAFAENVNANALRWSTTYNFRFVADQPPTSGEVTVGLFKPGTPASITIPAAVPSGSTGCAADFDGDGDLTPADFSAFRAAFLAGDNAADFDGDGDLTPADFSAFRAAFLAGCP